jgi:hypothetical protein
MLIKLKQLMLTLQTLTGENNEVIEQITRVKKHTGYANGSK